MRRNPRGIVLCYMFWESMEGIFVLLKHYMIKYTSRKNIFLKPSIVMEAPTTIDEPTYPIRSKQIGASLKELRTK